MRIRFAPGCTEGPFRTSLRSFSKLYRETRSTETEEGGLMSDSNNTNAKSLSAFLAYLDTSWSWRLAVGYPLDLPADWDLVK